MKNTDKFGKDDLRFCVRFLSARYHVYEEIKDCVQSACLWLIQTGKELSRQGVIWKADMCLRTYFKRRYNVVPKGLERFPAPDYDYDPGELTQADLSEYSEEERALILRTLQRFDKRPHDYAGIRRRGFHETIVRFAAEIKPRDDARRAVARKTTTTNHKERT